MKNTILNFWDRYRRYIVPLTLILCALLLFPHVVHADVQPAAGNTVQLPSSPDAENMYREIAKSMTFILMFLQRLLWPVLLLIGGLMKNDILFSSGMEDRMLEIWANIRNIVNILFVLLLLGIAFYNVIGGKNNAFHLKEALPKFVIGLIAVNFSFLGVKVIIDTVNIVSTAIFALPNEVQKDSDDPNKSNPDFSAEICKGLYGGDPSTAAAAIEKQNAASSNSAWCKPDGITLENKAQEFFTHWDGNNAAIIMAVNLGKIAKLDKAELTVKDIKNLATETIFSVTLYILYASAFIALFCVLLVRMIVLWVTIVLSPFMVLAYVLPENLKSNLGGAGELQKKFVKTAIVPIPIAIMMTIGFMMLKGLQQSSAGSLSLGSSLTLGATTQSLGFLSAGLSTFQDLIIAVGTIAVIWMGVFEAMKGTYADSIVDKIKGGVEGAGKFAMSAIKYAPILPVATKDEKGNTVMENMSLGTALDVAQRIPQVMDQQHAEQSNKFVTKMMGKNAAEAANQASKATNEKELLQPGVNLGSSAGTAKDYMKEVGDQLKRKNPGWKTKMDFSNVGNFLDDKDHKYTQESFIDAMAKGTAKSEAFNDFITRSAKNVDPNMKMQTTEDKKATPPAAAPPAAAGAAAAGATAAGATAAGATAAGAAAAAAPAISKKVADDLSYSAQYTPALSSKDKKNADAYFNAKTPKDKEDALKKAQDALGKLKEVADASIAVKARDAKDGNELEKIINERKEALKKENTGITDNQMDDILSQELTGVLTSGDEATKQKVNGSNQAQRLTDPNVVAAVAKRASDRKVAREATAAAVAKTEAAAQKASAPKAGAAAKPAAAAVGKPAGSNPGSTNKPAGKVSGVSEASGTQKNPIPIKQSLAAAAGVNGSGTQQGADGLYYSITPD